MLPYYQHNKIEVGIDEAGRGTLSGPVFCAAVILPQDIDYNYIKLTSEIKDSKLLSRKKRKELREFIEFIAIDFSVCNISNDIIDEINILNATQKCMHNCLDELNIVPDTILVDGNKFNDYYNNNELIDHHCIIGGDNKFLAIACASILAKEYHDEFISKLCEKNPMLNLYDWENNKCYGTTKHIDAIKKYGLTKYHRKTFGICKKYKK